MNIEKTPMFNKKIILFDSWPIIIIIMGHSLVSVSSY